MRTISFRTLFFVIVSTVFFACEFTQRKVEKSDSASSEFRLPDIPVYMGSADEKADFMACNYWSNFNFEDSLSITDVDIKNLFLQDFTVLLSSRPEAIINKSVYNLLDKASNNEKIRSFFVSELEALLYEPNSRLRNDDVYRVVLQHQVGCDKVSDLFKRKYADDLYIIEQNRVGEKANDFTFSLLSGESGRMNDVRAEMTMLFFFNPDCHTCEEYLAAMQDRENVIHKYIKSGRIKVVAIYPDEEVDLWRERYDKIPADWINCFDKSQSLRSVYDLRAIPSLYLLDRSKNVLIKDGYIQDIEDYLRKIDFN